MSIISLVPASPGIINTGDNSRISLGPRVGSCTKSGLDGASSTSSMKSGKDVGRRRLSSRTRIISTGIQCIVT